jgi:hypothetical protein
MVIANIRPISPSKCDVRSFILSGGSFGAPDTIRTCGLHLRRVALYPAELRVRYLSVTA